MKDTSTTPKRTIGESWRAMHPIARKFIVAALILTFLTAPLMADEAETTPDKPQQSTKAVDEAAEEKKRRNTLAEDDRHTLQDYTKENVKQLLKAPSTAKFQGGFLDPFDGWNIQFISKNVATVDSVVDSQNSFGAMIRSSYRFMYCKSDNKFSVMQYWFDGQASREYKTACKI